MPDLELNERQAQPEVNLNDFEFERQIRNTLRNDLENSLSRALSQQESELERNDFINEIKYLSSCLVESPLTLNDCINIRNQSPEIQKYFLHSLEKQLSLPEFKLLDTSLVMDSMMSNSLDRLMFDCKDAKTCLQTDEFSQELFKVLRKTDSLYFIDLARFDRDSLNKFVMDNYHIQTYKNNLLNFFNLSKLQPIKATELMLNLYGFNSRKQSFNHIDKVNNINTMEAIILEIYDKIANKKVNQTQTVFEISNPTMDDFLKIDKRQSMGKIDFKINKTFLACELANACTAPTALSNPSLSQPIYYELCNIYPMTRATFQDDKMNKLASSRFYDLLEGDRCSQLIYFYKNLPPTDSSLGLQSMSLMTHQIESIQSSRVEAYISNVLTLFNMYYRGELSNSLLSDKARQSLAEIDFTIATKKLMEGFNSVKLNGDFDMDAQYILGVFSYLYRELPVLIANEKKFATNETLPDSYIYDGRCAYLDSNLILQNLPKVFPMMRKTRFNHQALRILSEAVYVDAYRNHTKSNYYLLQLPPFTMDSLNNNFVKMYRVAYNGVLPWNPTEDQSLSAHPADKIPNFSGALDIDAFTQGMFDCYLTLCDTFFIAPVAPFSEANEALYNKIKNDIRNYLFALFPDASRRDVLNVYKKLDELRENY